MIYLLRTPAKNGTTLLKIGYTTDNESWKRRLDTYKSHNPDIDVLHIISEGTILHEVALHDKFRNYLERGKEWFKDVSEIEDYVKAVKIEDIDIEKYEIKQGRSDRSKIFTTAVRIAWEELERRGEDFNEVMDRFKNPRTLQQYIVGRVEYRELQNMFDLMKLTDTEINKVIYLNNKDYSDQPKEICNILNDFDKYTTFPDRMKLLCETYRGYFNDQELDVIFEQVPPDYKKLYKTIGPDKLKACSYNTTLVWKAYNNAVNPFKPEDLDSEIYSNFSEGQRISCTDAKDILKIVYQNNDIQKTANATDLGNYFDIKEAKIVLSDKSRVRGLKLIKKLR